MRSFTQLHRLARVRKLLGTCALAIVTLSSVFVLPSCTFKKIAYNNADFFISRRIDDYFDLDKTQKRRVDNDLRTVFAWHRRHALPQYVKVLDEFENKLETGLDTEKIDWLYSALDEQRSQLLDFIFPVVVPLLETLKKPQLETFRTEQQKNNEKRLENEKTPDLIKSKTIEAIEKWTGPLSESQELIVEKWLPEWETARLTRNELSQARQNQFFIMLNEIVDHHEQRQTKLSATSPDENAQNSAPQRTQIWQQKMYTVVAPLLPRDSVSQRARRNLYISLSQTLTAEQLNHMREQIQEWKTAFQSLSQT